MWRKAFEAGVNHFYKELRNTGLSIQQEILQEAVGKFVVPNN